MSRLPEPRRPRPPVQRQTTIRLRTQLYADATAIVEREYASDLDLDGIARRLATSRRQLQRAYSERSELSFRQQLAYVRMQRAAAMLVGSSLTVREVAMRVGYRQPAQFAKAFRRWIGTSPAAYRLDERHRRTATTRSAVSGLRQAA